MSSRLVNIHWSNPTGQPIIFARPKKIRKSHHWSFKNCFHEFTKEKASPQRLSYCFAKKNTHKVKIRKTHWVKTINSSTFGCQRAMRKYYILLQTHKSWVCLVKILVWRTVWMVLWEAHRAQSDSELLVLSADVWRCYIYYRQTSVSPGGKVYNSLAPFAGMILTSVFNNFILL